MSRKGQDVGDVLPFPHGGADESEVVEGELVDMDGDGRPDVFTSDGGRRDSVDSPATSVTAGTEVELYRGETPVARRVLAVRRVTQRVTVTAVTRFQQSPHPPRLGKAVLRNALYIPTGALIVAQRVWESKSSARYERQMRIAEATGNFDRLDDWEHRAEKAKERRHRRVMDWVKAPVVLAKALAIGVLSFAGLLLALGVLLAVANTNAGEVLAPIRGVLEFVRWATIVITLAWGPLVVAAPWLVALYLWQVGRASGAAPAWLSRLQPPPRDGGVVVTADGIVRALQHLGIPALTKALKDGWIPRFELNPTRDGNGFRAVFDIPLGVTAKNIADKRSVLARNLQRAEVEVWPADAARATDGRPGDIDLWVADSGVLSKPAPEYPLLHEGTGDVFAGVPIGVTQRGEEIPFPLVEANFVAGGQPGQGKSNLCRAILLGAALDPLAELWVHVFAGNGDFDAYAPRLARYQRGATKEVTESGMDSLKELHAEVGRREARLAELGAKKVTRALAEKHPDLRPLVSLYSECHELFGSEFGKDAAEYAVQTVRRGRKTGVILGFDTQSSRKDAIPPQLVELVRLNACFYVKTWRSNDGFLGDGSFAAGIRATELRPGKDRGTCLLTGVGEEAFELVKTFYIEADDDTGWDAATDVIARATAAVAPGVRTGAPVPTPVAELPRDLLDDLDEVLDTSAVKAADVPALLRELAPGWAPYRALKATELRQQLAALGVKVPSTGNRYPIDPVTVREALAKRATADLDEPSEPS